MTHVSTPNRYLIVDVYLTNVTFCIFGLAPAALIVLQCALAKKSANFMSRNTACGSCPNCFNKASLVFTCNNGASSWNNTHESVRDSLAKRYKWGSGTSDSSISKPSIGSRAGGSVSVFSPV